VVVSRTVSPAATLFASALLAFFVPAASANQAPLPAAPEGFLVEPAALPPLVRRPVLACFDDRGRLFVADAAPHRVVVLEDADGDGRFDKSSVFADKLDAVQGMAWHDGALFVASPPSLWQLRDTDGDDACDERRELLTGFARTGAADDLRGASVGPDGYVYTCAGRFPHEIKDVNGTVLHKGRAPLLVRCRPDGSGAEVVGGLQGNPAEVAWTAAGDAIVSGSLLGGEGSRDALLHSVEGGDYPVLGFLPEQHEMKNTGGPLPPLVRLPGTSPAGILRYRNMTFGRPFTDSLLCAEADAGKVRRHVLEPRGATFGARTEDFVSSASPDFHPTDVVEDADGSVLVVDAGGPADGSGAPGGIYRVRRDGAVRIADPRGLRLNWEQLEAGELVRRLQDLRPCVAERAVAAVGRLGAASIPFINDLLARSLNPRGRLNAVWALTRIDTPAAGELLRAALNDESPAVRQAAAYACGLRRDSDATPRLMDLVRGGAPAARREAANALGRIGHPAPALAAAAPPDQPPPGRPQGPPGGAVPAAPGQLAPAAPAATAGPAAGTATQPAAATQPQAPATEAQPATVPAATQAVVEPPPGPRPGPAAEAAPPPPPPPPAPAVPVLLEALRGNNDRFLAHAIIYALIRINDREATARGLQDRDPYVRRGAQLALDGMEAAKPGPVRVDAPAPSAS
jgi:putative membrane-bound dehydrogenase-like protein